MSILSGILGTVMVLFGGFIIVASYIRQIQNYKFKKTGQGKYSSPAPFVGPIFVIVGLTLMSVKLSGWVWLLFLIDPDTVLTVISLPMFFRQLNRR